MQKERLKQLGHTKDDDQLFMEAFAEEVTGQPYVPHTGETKATTFSDCLACRAVPGVTDTRIPVPHTCGKDLRVKVGEVQKTRQPNKQEVHKMKTYAANYKKRNPRASLADVTTAVAKKFNIQIME